MTSNTLDLQTNIANILEQLSDDDLSINIEFQFLNDETIVYFNVPLLEEFPRVITIDMVSAIKFYNLKYKVDGDKSVKNSSQLGSINQRFFSYHHNLDKDNSYFYEALVNSTSIRYLKVYESCLFNWVKIALKHFCLKYNYKVVDNSYLSSLDVYFSNKNGVYVSPFFNEPPFNQNRYSA